MSDDEPNLARETAPFTVTSAAPKLKLVVPESADPVPAPASTAGSFNHLTHVPGVVGDLVELIVGSARRPNRLLALGAAVTIVGTLVGRRIAGPTMSATHLYCVALAGTAAGKQHAIDCIKNVLIATGAAQLIGPDSFTSAPAVVKFLKRKPLSLCAIDELGSFLRRINNKNAGHYETAITGELRKLWGISWSRYDSSESAKDESQVVECPALSIYGVSTPEDFYSSLKSEDVVNGFLNRFLILETGPRGPEQDPTCRADRVSARVEDALKKLYGPTQAGLQVLNTSADGRVSPSLTLQWGPAAQDVYKELGTTVDEDADPQRQKLRSRVPEMAIRLATIRAAGMESPFVSVEDMVWGRDLAALSSEMLCKGVAQHMIIPLEFSEMCPEIISRMRARGGKMSERDILRSFQKHVKRGVDIGLALKHLEMSEQVSKEKVIPPHGGRSSFVYSIIE